MCKVLAQCLEHCKLSIDCGRCLFFLSPLVHTHSLVPRAKNNAERIFALMPEKNAHSYCTMIRGMVKVIFVLLFIFCSSSPEDINCIAFQSRKEGRREGGEER